MDDEEVRDALESGVWMDAVDRWMEDGDVEDSDLDLIDEIGLLDEFEFFWDDEVSRVGYECPSIPKDWKNREYSDRVDGWAQVSRINMSLDDLGGVAREILEDRFLVD